MWFLLDGMNNIIWFTCLYHRRMKFNLKISCLVVFMARTQLLDFIWNVTYHMSHISNMILIYYEFKGAFSDLLIYANRRDPPVGWFWRCENHIILSIRYGVRNLWTISYEKWNIIPVIPSQELKLNICVWWVLKLDWFSKSTNENILEVCCQSLNIEACTEKESERLARVTHYDIKI